VGPNLDGAGDKHLNRVWLNSHFS